MKIKNYFLNRAIFKSGLPIHLIWFITSRCNLQCQHCFYHDKISVIKDDELCLKEIEITLSNLGPLLSLSLTGGEPFLRKDLTDIIKLIAKFNLTQNILLFTNGISTGLVLEKIEKIVYDNNEINFFIGVSIDGKKIEHDKYRGQTGAYEKAITTLYALQKLEKHFENLNIGVCSTFHHGNQATLIKFWESIYKEFDIIPGMTIIRGNPKNIELKKVDTVLYKQALDWIEEKRSSLNKQSLFQTLVNTRINLGHRMAYNVYTSGKRTYDCYAGKLMGVISETGDVFPCEMLDNANIGNLRNYNYDLENIWRSPKAFKIREEINTKKCSCTYECQYTTNTLYNVKYWRYFIAALSKQFILNPR